MSTGLVHGAIRGTSKSTSRHLHTEALTAGARETVVGFAD